MMAHTIRFGTTCDPCKVPSSGDTQSAVDTDEKGNCDPDKLVQCPFDKNHQIRVCRLPYHLLKCGKNHPKLASELKTCPFNARHLVPRHELMYHTETCEDRIPVSTDDDDATNGHCRWQVPVSTWVNPNVTEDWDQEADDGAVPFVWGETRSLDMYKETRPTNNLGQTSRVPNTLPW
ncbi:gametocyte-specific factor 1 isoform X2 [Halichoeres trimaculatus]|uniref:gametocyte-specific factor 1 isoform X2 n=1 Tax=Halichoeres trimaculatus TaxID=147232 RepID=UPI003D9F9D51